MWRTGPATLFRRPVVQITVHLQEFKPSVAGRGLPLHSIGATKREVRKHVSHRVRIRSRLSERTDQWFQVLQPQKTSPIAGRPHVVESPQHSIEM